jgi:hypothetical protein
VISVDIFWAEIYRGRHFFGPNELKLSPLDTRYRYKFYLKSEYKNIQHKLWRAFKTDIHVNNKTSTRTDMHKKQSTYISKLGYTIFFQVKTTTHFTRLTPVKLFIGCFFFFVQLNNYISNLSLLKYFIQKIYGKRDISQQVVTLSKFGNARIMLQGSQFTT